MTVATIKTQVVHGPTGTPVYTDIEAPGVLHFNRQDDEAIGSPVVAPSGSLHSTYSNYKSLRLNVSVAGTTTVSNLRVRTVSAMPTGLGLFGLTTAPSSYTQCTGAGATQGNRPADSTAALTASPAPNTPASYSAVPASPSSLQFDSASYATTATGAFGKFCQLVGGISDQYVGGAGSAIAVPQIQVQYDEA